MMLPCARFTKPPGFPPVFVVGLQVAARFLLAKHREFVHEMFLDGLMNEKVKMQIHAVRH